MSIEHLFYPIGRFSNNEHYSDEETIASIEEIRALPAELRAVVYNLPEGALERHYREGSWTGRQVIHHVADSHSQFLTRLKLALTEENPTIKPYDENAWAQQIDYAMPIDDSVELVRIVHEKIYCIVAALPPDALRRTYYHPQYQYRRDIAYLIALYAWHGKHHVGHLKLLQNS
jgi:hypothetical protein